MKHSNIKTLFLAIPFLLLAFSACKKDVAGPKGDSGTDGKKGNLKKSERTFTVQTSSWINNSGFWNATIYFPEITNDVITKGEVKVYMKIGTQWWSLPYAVGDIMMHQSIEFEYLHLEYSRIHGIPPSSPGQVTFRVVVSQPV
ncbi:MAG: hypothetical protein SGJ15_07175 [Bacteroidota bacterium]|nr:hypothetical protein [Bacteroidota bacterium]